MSERNYIVLRTGSTANKKFVIVCVLSTLLVLPFYHSANAELFVVTTTKAIYAPEEKATVLGIIPIDAASSNQVEIKVTGPAGEPCSDQTISPDRDNSFVSRPIPLDHCAGAGEYSVTAYYANMTSYSSFIVSEAAGKNTAAQLELSMIKNTLLNAQRIINSKLQDRVNDNLTLSNEIIEIYTNGTSEVSLAIQAAQYGDVVLARDHEVSAIEYFTSVLRSLSAPAASASNSTSLQAGEDLSAKIVNLNDDLSGLQQFYNRLVEISRNNQLDTKTDQFNAISTLLSNTRTLLSNGDVSTAERNLTQMAQLIEALRSDLIKTVESQKIAATLGGESSSDRNYGKRLAHVADKLQNDANELLDKSGNNSDATALIQASLSLINNARTDISNGHNAVAKQALSQAMNLLSQAKHLIDKNQS